MEKVKNALLVFAPAYKDYSREDINDGPVLGLISLKHYVTKVQGLDSKIDIVDGDYTSFDKIKQMIDSGKYQICGIQPKLVSYKNALDIAEYAKSKGLQVVMGGHHATQLADNIIKNRHKIIDCVVAGDGEDAFTGLIKGEKFENIPNLVYYKDGQVKKTEQQNAPMTVVDSWDKSDIEQYERPHKLRQGLERDKQTVSYRTSGHKGCYKRVTKACYFCGRADYNLRFKKPEDYIKELTYLSQKTDAEYIWEVGDDFLQNKKWIKRVVELLKDQPLRKDMFMRIFARANHITPETIPFLKELKVRDVIIGFESADQDILKRIGKGDLRPEDNLNAAKLLFENGMEALASYCLGLPGETKQTLEKNLAQARQLRELGIKHLGRPPRVIVANILEIVPGSPAYLELLEKMPGKYSDKDDICPKEIQEDYFRTMFNLKNDDEIANFKNMLTYYSNQINNVGKYHTFVQGSYLGVKKSDEKKQST